MNLYKKSVARNILLTMIILLVFAVVAALIAWQGKGILEWFANIIWR